MLPLKSLLFFLTFVGSTQSILCNNKKTIIQNNQRMVHVYHTLLEDIKTEKEALSNEEYENFCIEVNNALTNGSLLKATSITKREKHLLQLFAIILFGNHSCTRVINTLLQYLQKQYPDKYPDTNSLRAPLPQIKPEIKIPVLKRPLLEVPIDKEQGPVVTHELTIVQKAAIQYYRLLKDFNNKNFESSNSYDDKTDLRQKKILQRRFVKEYCQKLCSQASKEELIYVRHFQAIFCGVAFNDNPEIIELSNAFNTLSRSESYD